MLRNFTFCLTAFALVTACNAQPEQKLNKRSGHIPLSGEGDATAGGDGVDGGSGNGNGPDGAGGGSGNGNGPDGAGGAGGDHGAGGPDGASGSGSNNEGTPEGASGSSASQVVEKTFTNPAEGDSDFTFDLTNGRFQQEILLQEKFSNKKLDFTQVTRPAKADLFKQNTTGNQVTDHFMQDNSSGVLDLLIVMDNSGSMAEEQKEISTRLGPLLQYVTNSSWRIGVVTTDPSDPCMRAVITKGDANTDAAFVTAVQPGIKGSGDERGIESAVKGLGCPTNNWIRSGSSLAVLIVSDEDNCSDGCSSSYTYKPSYLINYLGTTMGRAVGTDARVYGIYWQPGTSCNTGASRANEYHTLVTSTGGVSGSICAADYTPVLQSISKNIAETLKTQFQLSSTPDANSVTVLVNGQPWTDYSISGNIISFTQAPPLGASIEVQYVTGAQPQLKTFTFSSTPLVNSVSVSINGQPVASSAYSIDYAARTITFNDYPPGSSEILAAYKMDVQLTSEFPVSKTAVASSVKVFVNNNQVSNVSYDAGAGLIRFSSPPAEGAAIRVEYIQNDGPNLVYPFSPIGANVTDIAAYDKVTNESVAVTINGNLVTVAPGSFKAGRIIVISYRSDESNKSSFQLPKEPIAGSVTVLEGPASCALGSGITVQGKQVDVNCKVPDNTAIKLGFKYQLPAAQSYVMEDVKKPDAGQWEVKVNNVKVSDYRREGNKIIFDKTLPVGATVYIKHSSWAFD